MRPKAVIWSIFLLIMIVGWAPIDEDSEEQYLIRAGSRRIIPIEGERLIPLGISRHLVVQFYQIPDESKRRELTEQGIKLLSYLDGNAYIASVTAEGDRALPSVGGVRAVLALEPDMKLSPLLQEEVKQKALHADDSPISVVVVFHEDIPFEHALEAIGRVYLTSDQTDYHYFQWIKLEVNSSALMLLLLTDEVEWIDPSLPPPIPHNAWAAKRATVNKVWNKASYKKPKGKAERIGVWEGGKVGQHKALKGRVNVVETDGEPSDHATHVAGTIAGSGKGNKDARGMATAARIYSYNFYGAPVDEMLDAVEKFGIKISNNSWGLYAGWRYSSEEERWEWWGNKFFGYYHTQTKSQDRLVRDTDLLVVRSAGNDRKDAYLGPYYDVDSGKTKENLKPSDPEYGSVETLASGKNIVTVGALMKDDAITAFSNWGPTDEGRIKPELVATGRDLISCLPNNKYDTMSGTSMSTPVVSGTAALLREVNKKYVGGSIGSALLKCLLIHTARDLGPEGPDYSYGFGLIDAQYAADIIKANSSTTSGGVDSPLANLSSKMIEGSVKNKKQVSYKFSVASGAKELRSTLVWHDPEGKQLVNNLNLWLESPNGKKKNPFTLNPKKPETLAKRKMNNKDNVEHILIKNPSLGKWTVYVKGQKVPTGPQSFALIISAGDGNSALQTKNAGKISIRKVYAHSKSDFDLDEKKTFSHGEDIYFKVAFNLPENADWGSFYGTVGIKWVVSRKGKTIFKTNSAKSSLYPTSGFWMTREGRYIIPTGMAKGTYVLKVTVTLHNGVTETKKYNFKVQ